MKSFFFPLPFGFLCQYIYLKTWVQVAALLFKAQNIFYHFEHVENTGTSVVTNADVSQILVLIFRIPALY